MRFEKRKSELEKTVERRTQDGLTHNVQKHINDALKQSRTHNPHANQPPRVKAPHHGQHKQLMQKLASRSAPPRRKAAAIDENAIAAWLHAQCKTDHAVSSRRRLLASIFDEADLKVADLCTLLKQPEDDILARPLKETIALLHAQAPADGQRDCNAFLAALPTCVQQQLVHAIKAKCLSVLYELPVTPAVLHALKAHFAPADPIQAVQKNTEYATLFAMTKEVLIRAEQHFDLEI